MPKNLQPINPPEPAFRFTCVGCGKRADSSDGFADLNGEAYRAYYCAPCGVADGWAAFEAERRKA